MSRNALWGAAALGAAALAIAAVAEPAARAADEAPWTEAALKLEVSVEFKFRTPRDGSNSQRGSGVVRGNWLDVTDGRLPLTGVKGGQLRFEPRTPAIVLDLDGDGNYETTAKQDFFQVQVKQGDVTGKYAFRLRREWEKWWFQRCCMAVGEIEKTAVRFVDDDNDGKFDGIGKDVVLVGNAVGAGYLGRLLPVKGKLYEVAVDAAGTRLKHRPWTAPDGASPGRLDLFAGYRAKGKPAIAVAKQVGADDLFFECNAKGGVPVPPGEYELHEAIMGPTRDQMCIVTKGKMDNIKVESGKTTTLDWGFPGTIDFQFTRDGTLLDITYDSVKTYGKAGELYDRFEPVSLSIGCEVKEEKSGKRVWFGPYTVVHQLRLATQVPWIVQLSCDNVAYLGPFVSAWQ